MLTCYVTCPARASNEWLLLMQEVGQGALVGYGRDWILVGSCQGDEGPERREQHVS